MRTWIVGAALVAAIALVAPEAWARIVEFGRGTSVNCGTTPTRLDDTSISNARPRYLQVRGIYGGGEYFIGRHTAALPLTVANGFPMRSDNEYHSGERVDADDAALSTALYCITASGTVPVRVWETP